jgi:gonadotropin-releasing hormone receptor
MEELDIEEEWLVTPHPFLMDMNYDYRWTNSSTFLLNTTNCDENNQSDITQFFQPNTTRFLCDVINTSHVTRTFRRPLVLEVPEELTFTNDNLISVIAYTLLLFLSGSCNLLVFLTLFRSRHRKSRVNLLIMHLCIADMIVTFVMIPLEIGWHITVAWIAGDCACRLLMFFRALGFYLSSFILISISLDRYFAITHPLSLNDAGKRARGMLWMAWILSIFASIPQVSHRKG